jgi:hypothetical protein
MNSLQKKNLLTYTVFLLALPVLLIGCKQTDTSQNIAKSDKPHHRKIKNGAQYAEDVNSGKILKDDFIGSPLRTTSANIGWCDINIKYSSPGVRGRKIWGNLVPYNKIWVTGANHATAITFNHDVLIDNRKLPPGTYAFFTIPKKEDWVVIFNKNSDQHLTDDYSKKEDVLRFTVHPTETPVIVQRLTYKIVPGNDGSALISMMWEKRNISFVIKRYQVK